MSTATLTSKGQITIPADVRRSLNVEPGDRGKAPRRVSLDEMNASIATNAVRNR